jgi:hypothetical protein
MGRSLGLALAVTLCVLGLECLVVKRATLSIKEPSKAPASDYSFLDPSLSSSAPSASNRIIEPPEWAPFGLLASGIVLLIYARTLSSGG